MKKSELKNRVKKVLSEKQKGVDGKACWKGYRYAGTKNGKDICVKITEESLDASTQAPNKIPGGLAQFATIGDLAQMHKLPIDQIIKQILKGVKIESEHTSDLDIAMEIAFDHVYEDPKYYDRLSSIEEMADMRSVERYADGELDPVDVEFGKHFFDRLIDPRNGKEITTSELLDFFARLSNKKEQFFNFIKKYHEFVVKDRKTNINSPFMSQINQAIAKTIMRKPNFMTSNPVIALQEKSKKK